MKFEDHLTCGLSTATRCSKDDGGANSCYSNPISRDAQRPAARYFMDPEIRSPIRHQAAPVATRTFRAREFAAVIFVEEVDEGNRSAERAIDSRSRQRKPAHRGQLGRSPDAPPDVTCDVDQSITATAVFATSAARSTPAVRVECG